MTKTSKKVKTSKKINTSSSVNTSKRKTSKKEQIEDEVDLLIEKEISGDKAYQQSKSKKEHNQVFLSKDGIIQPQFRITKKKRTKKEEEAQLKILADYQKANKTPFYLPNNSKDQLSTEYFKKLSKVDIVCEKEELLTSEEKKKKFLSTEGNHVQTQVFDGNYYGFYYQKKSKASKAKPTPKLAKCDTIKVDNDEAGHFIAYITNYYGNNDIEAKNVYFGSSKTPEKVDLTKAHRFLSKSLLNSLSYKQSKALEDALKQKFGKEVLKYRNQGTVTDLRISEQKLHICKAVNVKKAYIVVKTIDRELLFETEIRAFDEAKPILTFVEQNKTEAKRLDSDTLLKVIVRKFGIQPESAQSLLESLHNQGWISYPRIDNEKAIEEPIRLLKPLYDESGKTVFKGTLQEYEVLHIIYNAEQSFNNNENYVQSGVWELRSGDLSLYASDVILSDEQKFYTEDEFDIIVDKRSINPYQLLDNLIENEIGTSATRTYLITELKQAGVLTLKNDNYILDQKGFYLLAGLQIIEENTPLAVELAKEINEAKDTKAMVNIINKYKIVNRKLLSKQIKTRAEELLEAESDLTYLDQW